MSHKVFVGLSGGVDSAVSAALLQRAGYDVTGVFIKIWQPEFVECTWREDRLSAMRAAAWLRIPFREIDLSDEYKKLVVDEMVAAYAAGRTPNPDISCNEYIKFGAFFNWARSQGAQYVATGHYARVVSRGGRHTLMRGADTAKDQSYFLSRIGEDVLPHVLFPVGRYTKRVVRLLAWWFGLPHAHRPDSQGLCFVGNIRMDEMLARLMPTSRGVVKTLDGKEIGTHKGATLYTIGQRHGFTASGVGPWYVTRIDPVRNELTVSLDLHDAACTTCTLTDVLWYVSSQEKRAGNAQVRYRDKVRACTVTPHIDVGAHVEFAQPVIVSPGQSVVGYDGDTVVWSGIVASCA